MKKILVVFTGGTIGSRVLRSTINVDESARCLLIKLFHEKCQLEVDFDVIQPMNILSENCTPNHWKILCDAIKQIDTQKYEGIIVTHGTDTLPYTAAILSFVFHGSQIPIVITGSNYSLEDSNSNGLENFYNSVCFILGARLPGVFAVYRNNQEKNIVYLASRLMEADSYNDQYLSFGGVDFGEMIDGSFVIEKDRIIPTREMMLERREDLLRNKLDFVNEVFAIKPYPGLNYDFFNIARKPKAILHSLYHSGTACINHTDHSLPNFINKCNQAGIDFYLISFKNINSAMYATSREILGCNAIPLQNISFEAAYAKLCVAYNQNDHSPLELMKRELFFEFLPN